MNVPNADRAEISSEKIIDYLLDPEHEDGGPKAKFFLGWGFQPDAWDVMAQALNAQIVNYPFAEEVVTPFGVKYSVIGPLEAPNGTTPPVKSIWIILQGTDHPRLVTAFPAN